MLLGVWGAMAGHTLTKLFALAVVARAKDDEQRALVLARELDAVEVGRRADRRRARARAAEPRDSTRH